VKIVARILDSVVAVASEDAVVSRALEALMAMYPRSDAPAAISYSLGESTLVRDGETVDTYGTREALARAFEGDLYRTVVERARPSFLLHAAAVATERGAVVLFGPSGAGKTTVSGALVARGARYITDEFVAIDAQLQVRGVPRPLCLDQDTEQDPLRRALAGEIHRYRFDDFNGMCMDVPLFALADEHVCREPAPLVAIVHLRHAPEEKGAIRPLRASDALTRAWSERYRYGPDELDIAIAVMQSIPAYELVTNNVEQACRAVLDVVLGDRAVAS
jgi:hypothetical protein